MNIPNSNDSPNKQTPPQIVNSASKMQKKPRPAELVADSVENYLQGYDVIAEWIRFADAKAAVVLTVNGALAGLIIPTLKPFLGERLISFDGQSFSAFDFFFHADNLIGITFPIAMICFAIWVVLMIVSGGFAFLCITPFRSRGEHPSLNSCANFHPTAIARHFKLTETERYTNETLDIGMRGLERQVLAAILVDSHISNTKYRRVTSAIKFFALSVCFGFGYLLLKQF